MRSKRYLLEEANRMRLDGQMAIDSPETLDRAAIYYHDQTFDVDDIIFDEEKHEFSIEYWRVMYEEAKLRKDYIVFQILVAPVIRSKLIFCNVMGANIQSTEPDDEMTEIIYCAEENEIHFKCVKDTKIILKVTNLDGLLQNIGEKFSEAHKYGTFMYWMEFDHSVRPPHDNVKQ